jgi:hypothetical protein
MADIKQPGRILEISVILVLLGAFIFWAFDARSDDQPRIQVGGYFEGYYEYGANQPAAGNRFRGYDSAENQLTLDLAEISFSGAVEDFSFIADLDFGSFAETNDTNESSRHLGQGVLSWKPKDSRFSFDFGKMYTHLGFETAKARENWQFSRSNLYLYGIPFWHTGVAAHADWIASQFSTSLYLYNGWNSLTDTNRSKTAGAQVKWTVGGAALVYNVVGGPEKANDEADWRIVHDVNATYSISKGFDVALDGIAGSERNSAGDGTRPARWSAGTAAVRVGLGTDFISPRFEIYRDTDGFTLGSVPQTLKSVTLTYGHPVRKVLEGRLEYRMDMSDRATFDSIEGAKKTQSTYLAGFSAKF